MILFPLLAALFSAMETNVSKKILEKASVPRYTQSYFMFATIIQLPLLLFFRITKEFVLLSILGGILSFAANMFYFSGLKVNKVCDVAPLKVLALLVTTVLSYIFFAEERFSFRIYLVLGLIVLSLYLLYSSESNFIKAFFSRKSILIIVAMLFWGIFYTFLKYAVSVQNPFFMYWGTGVSFLSCGIIYNILKGEKIGFIPLRPKINLLGKKIPLGIVFFSLAVIILGEYYLLYASVASFSSTISIILYNTDVIFITLLSILLFKHRISGMKWVAIGLSFLAIILLKIWI